MIWISVPWSSLSFLCCFQDEAPAPYFRISQGGAWIRRINISWELASKTKPLIPSQSYWSANTLVQVILIHTKVGEPLPQLASRWTSLFRLLLCCLSCICISLALYVIFLLTISSCKCQTLGPTFQTGITRLNFFFPGKLLFNSVSISNALRIPTSLKIHSCSICPPLVFCSHLCNSIYRVIS